MMGLAGDVLLPCKRAATHVVGVRKIRHGKSEYGLLRRRRVRPTTQERYFKSCSLPAGLLFLRVTA